MSSDQTVTASFRARPAIGGLSLSAKTFKPAASGPTILPVSHRSNRGVVVRFTLNQLATVRFTIEQQLPGRRTGKGTHARCVAPTRHNRNAPRCKRTVTLPGSFTVTGKAGANSLRFTGRLAGRTLPPGSYTLIATPTAARLAGNPVKIAFRISA